MDWKDLWPWHHCRSARSLRAVGCVSRELKPPLPTESSRASVGSFLVVVSPRLTGPSVCVWWGQGQHGGLVRTPQPLLQWFLLSPAVLPCNLPGQPEHTLQAAAWPPGVGSGIDNSSSKAPRALLVWAPRTVRVTIPGGSAQLLAECFPKPDPWNSAFKKRECSWGLSFDILT